MGDYILAIDEGTTNVKAVLIDVQANITAEASQEIKRSYPKPGWVEQDPREIWNAVRATVDECLEKGNHPDLHAVGLSVQRETVLLWDRNTGEPLAPAIVWQDRRTTDFAQQLRSQELESKIRGLTGLTIDAEFPSSKTRWLLENIPNAREKANSGEVCFGQIDSWLLWNLSGGKVHVSDAADASRTQLYNLADETWDQELLDIFDIPEAILPEVKPCSHVYAETVEIGSLPAGIPIASAIGDSHASLFGHTGFRPGAIKVTYGTGCSMMTPMSSAVISENGISTTIAWERDEVVYAFEGVTLTGAAVQWVGEFMNYANPAQEVAERATQVDDNGGVYFVPALAGLGAPYWKDSAKAVISGLTQGSTPDHLCRAAIESIAYQVRAMFDIMQAESGSDLQTLLADGGPTRNDMLMQFQADILGVPVMRSTSPYISLLGAAYLAGLATGFWESEEELLGLPHPRDVFEPKMDDGEREKRYTEWEQAVDQAIIHTR